MPWFLCVHSDSNQPYTIVDHLSNPLIVIILADDVSGRKVQGVQLVSIHLLAKRVAVVLMEALFEMKQCH